MERAAAPRVPRIDMEIGVSFSGARLDTETGVSFSGARLHTGIGVPRIDTKTDAYHVRNVVLRKRSGSVRETNNHGDGDRKYNYSFFAVSTGCQRFCQRRIAHVVSDRTSVIVAFFYCFSVLFSNFSLITDFVFI